MTSKSNKRGPRPQHSQRSPRTEQRAHQPRSERSPRPTPNERPTRPERRERPPRDPNAEASVNGTPAAPRAFSWFPGHMHKAMLQLEASLDLADVVLLVMDARIPASSRQPEIEELLRRKNKEVLLVLNKSDIADAAETRQWVAALQEEGFEVASMRSTAGKGAGPLAEHIERLRASVQEKRKRKGLLPRDPRIVVAGIPNVGKSSLLNRLAGANRAKTGAKPGVTRGNQWVAVPGMWQVLDSPGILYPRIEGEDTLTSLAAANCVSHNVIPLERVGGLFLKRLVTLGKGQKLLGNITSGTPEELLTALAQRKNFFISPDELDLERTARFALKAFSLGELGPITLEIANPQIPA